MKKILVPLLILLSAAAYCVDFKTDKPGNLYVPGDDMRAEFISDTAAPWSVTFRDSFGNAIGRKDGKSSEKFALKLPKVMGCVRIEWSHGGDSGAVYYDLIPDNSALFGKPGSPFGVNTHFNQGWDLALGETARRAGITWIRDGEANPDDRGVAAAKKYGLRYMPCFTFSVVDTLPSIIEKTKKGDTDFAEEIDFFVKFAEKYGDFVTVYDICNEPNNTPWTNLGGDWSGGPWLDVFCKWGAQVAAAIRKVDSDAEIMWEDIDIGHLWAKQMAENGITTEADIIAAHPYNLHRENPLPENQGFDKDNDELRKLMAEKGLKWRLMDGEVGYSSYEVNESNKDHHYTPCSPLLQASWLARMYITHLSNGVERVFWYDLKCDGADPHEPEHNFGLIRHDGTPKPAICAYANLINILEGCRWTGFRDGIYTFVSREGKKCAAAWVPTGTGTASVKTDARKATLIDLFGNRRTVKPVKGELKLTLTESPVYFIGL